MELNWIFIKCILKLPNCNRMFMKFIIIYNFLTAFLHFSHYQSLLQNRAHMCNILFNVDSNPLKFGKFDKDYSLFGYLRPCFYQITCPNSYKMSCEITFLFYRMSFWKFEKYNRKRLRTPVNFACVKIL